MLTTEKNLENEVAHVSIFYTLVFTLLKNWKLTKYQPSGILIDLCSQILVTCIISQFCCIGGSSELLNIFLKMTFKYSPGLSYYIRKSMDLY